MPSSTPTPATTSPGAGRPPDRVGPHRSGQPTQITGDLHDGSVSLRVAYGQVAFMFTGDAEAATEEAMAQRGHDLGAQILQVGHHGSRTSSTAGFLQAEGPEVASTRPERTTSTGILTQKPSSDSSPFSADICGTDVHGTVRVVTDGTTFRAEGDGPGTSTPITATGIAATTTTTAAATPARCGTDQVDINSAGVGDLQEIIHIGPVRAQEMLTLRPFRSVDDMTRINGIGSARLADIKAQGVACVP